ncbi:MAG: hypothetical protein R3330_07275 [Saprospiraceae bacterium]|nr:hypothetical protein [Saprospiraceae bacterium]
MSRYIVYLSATCIALIMSACGQHKPADADAAHLGSVTFDVSCNEKATPYFNQGLLLLHSFEYDDAAEAFQSAQQADPACAMAYWGEAMTKNHPLWSAQYTDEAVEILARFGDSPEARLAKIPEGIERDLFEAVEILYGEGDKQERDQQYAAHMAVLYEAHPGHHEVAAFYALSLLGSASDGRDEALYGKGAVIAKGILDENPQHPGALHYLIHSYDDPGHAHLAIDAADNYAQVAPDAGHALHMPSHIYIALGMWDEVIASNIAAWEAGNSRMERKELDNDARNYHALQWLMYGYLQTGDMAMARQQLDLMMKYGSELPSKRARAYMTMMRAAYLVDANTWDDSLARMAIEDEDLNVSIRSINDFIEGMTAYRAGDVAALEGVIAQMQKQRSEEHKRMLQRGAAMCSGVNWTSQLPNQQDINHSHIMEMELQALHAMLTDDLHQAEMWFNQAIALDEETPFMFGPPTVVKPVPELYGEWLMARDMHAEAAVQFDKALQRAPKRRISSEYKARIGPAG